MTTSPDNEPPHEVSNRKEWSLAISRWKLSAIPLAPPRVDRSLPRQGHLARSTTVLHHTLHRFEFWLSPNGLLREWCRRCLLLALFTAVPLLCISPLVAVFLEHLTTWSAALLQICSNLAQIPGRLSAGVLIAVAGGLLLRWLLRH
ncbi:hypothetical protein DES53_111135 [Roseimicrobium gellanilyticum]|uniref:Uncharacterized protein n=1 Tax=Roseimicrobium gellanilyticum TaxID=748857 RepID=A0A366HAA4_9BACT|nr:hypothetical protein [Roseimicrobium gellanilyticum]RBP38616.1 hypothetical protein DES53_111135 [Roseimicrobium gellanilyticum]